MALGPSKGAAYDAFIARLKTLGERGFRAVLWHQGESDANQKDATRTLPGRLYREYLEKLIRDSRRDIEWNAPWFVAQASYHVPGDEGSDDIRAAQASLWKDGIALEGPDSDALKGPLRERNGQGVHFSGPGLREHGACWAAKVLPWLEEQWTASRAATRVAEKPASSAKPNVIFILADDLGVGNVGCYGADNFQTPHIDRLASGGIRYTHAYTVPLCGPSRAALMTGRYAFRTGATNQDATGLMKPSVETMIPAVLKRAGYVSSMVGKWGQLPLGPRHWGFDDEFRFKGSGVYWNSKDDGKSKGESYVVNGQTKRLGDKEYLPDLMHRHMVEFITQHRGDPFFVYYSLSHVHGEIVPTPDSKPDSRDLFADNVAYMDKLVGQLVAELERLRLREKTVLVFMGDNGTGKGYADRSTIGGKRLSGEKGSMLEGDAHVPLIVNWPGVARAGTVATGMVDSTDFLPTFAELARVELPKDHVIDGFSLVTHWCGLTAEPRDWVFIELARQWYVREPQWKLNQAGELFDMSNSPFAEKLVPTSTKDAAALAARQRLQAVLDELNPAGGLLDTGDGTGRHATRTKKKVNSK